jgi:hypothetical protein
VTIAPATGLARWTPWLAALSGLALTLWVFYPGYMSWDSAYQWWQVRHGIVDPIFPPLMVGIWRVTDALWPGPGGYFVFQATVYWAAFAWFAAALRLSAGGRAVVVLALGLWPPVWAVSAHLWKDVGMLSWFVCAVACACHELQVPSRRQRALALVFLALACAYRFNAISAVLPLALWLGWRDVSAQRGLYASRGAGVAVGLLFTGLVAVAGSVPTWLIDKAPTPVWPVIAQWDIAAVSIAENRNLFPPRWADPTLTVPELRRAFSPATNTSLYEGGKVTLHYATPMSDADYATLRSAWFNLPVAHTRPYFAHRLRVAELMFGGDPVARPGYLVLSPAITAYADNPPVLLNASPWHDRIQTRLNGWIGTPLFAGWTYLLLALAVVGGACLERLRAGSGLAMAIAGSGLLLALPLVFLAPSTDFRYINWLLAASLMAPLAWRFARPADSLR